MAIAPADLIGLAERARTDDWTMRSALVRYAQPEPLRASAVLELIRRLDGALHPHARAIERGDEPDEAARSLLAPAAVLDHLGDVLVAWARDPAQSRPDDVVDGLVRDVFGQLADLDIPRETRPTRRA